ncbi:hypothetical protein [Methanofollis tationis]|uniref:Uncharacterized protein n=1 Tax=Methanofollis tationis TaxID=81417 RepID=A0A7K4HLF1_9EURY|nr:hypothetical protein [Methanofollis tationis]NVO65750.1 hypothetical protein [Methanofollis tationis]
MNLQPGGSFIPRLITYSTTALKELKALAELGILERRSPSKKKTHYVLAQGPVPDA